MLQSVASHEEHHNNMSVPQNAGQLLHVRFIVQKRTVLRSGTKSHLPNDRGRGGVWESAMISVAWLPARIGSVRAHTLPSPSLSLLYYVCWQANTFSWQVVQTPTPHLHLIQTCKVSFGFHVCFTATKCFIRNCTLLKLRHKNTWWGLGKRLWHLVSWMKVARVTRSPNPTSNPLRTF